MTRLRVLWALAASLLASHFAIAYVNGTQSWIDLARYADGTERLPFQYRALTGWLLRAGLHLPGLTTIAAHASHKMAVPLNILWTGLTFVSALWIMLCALQVSRLVFESEVAARLASLSIAIPLYIEYEALANSYRLSYAYDLPSLALFFTCLLTIVRHQRTRMLGFFALSTLSRETSLYLIPVFLCWSLLDRSGKARPWREFMQGVDGLFAAAMGVIWLGTRAILRSLYAANPLDTAAAHLSGVAHGIQIELPANLATMTNPLQWPGLLSSLCWLWLPVLSFWNAIEDRRLRAAIAVTTPLVIVTMFVAGRITEPRVFAEMTLLYWMAVLQQTRKLGKVWGVVPTPSPNLRLKSSLTPNE